MADYSGMGVKWPLGGMGLSGGAQNPLGNLPGMLLGVGMRQQDQAREDAKLKAAEARNQQQLDQQAALGAWTKVSEQMKTPGLPRAVQHQLYQSSRPLAEKLGFVMPDISVEEWGPNFGKLFQQASAVLSMPGTYEEKQQRLNAMLADASGDPNVALIIKRQDDMLKAQREAEVAGFSNLAYRHLAGQASEEESRQLAAQMAIANAPDRPDDAPYVRTARQERAIILAEAYKNALKQRDEDLKRNKETFVTAGKDTRVLEQTPGGLVERVGVVTEGPALSQPIKDVLAGDFGVDVRTLDPSKPNDAAVIARARRQVEDDARRKAVADAEALIPVEVKKKRQLEGVKSQEVSETAVSGMRNSFTQAAKTFVDVRDAYARVQTSAKDPSAAGDLSLIYGYMKMLDPGSVVREAEFAQAAQAGAYGDRIQSYVNRALTGQRLADTIRKDFVDRAGKLFETQLGTHAKLEDEYARIAKSRGINASDVVIDYVGEFRKGKGGGSAPAVSSTANNDPLGIRR
jgi:hypothetical protein